MAQKQAAEKPKTAVPPERCWIKYQLHRNGVRYAQIAERAGCKKHYVSMVILGRRRSEKVEAAVAELLRISDWDALMQIALVWSKREPFTQKGA